MSAEEFKARNGFRVAGNPAVSLKGISDDTESFDDASSYPDALDWVTKGGCQSHSAVWGVGCSSRLLVVQSTPSTSITSREAQLTSCFKLL
jgi:hypothetical protein